VSLKPPDLKPHRKAEPAGPEKIPGIDHIIAIASGKGGVGKSTVDKWVRQLRKERDGSEVKAGPISSEQRRIKELERENHRLKEEKEILKKATALLMSDSMNGLR